MRQENAFRLRFRRKECLNAPACARRGIERFRGNPKRFPTFTANVFHDKLILQIGGCLQKLCSADVRLSRGITRHEEGFLPWASPGVSALLPMEIIL